MAPNKSIKRDGNELMRILFEVWLPYLVVTGIVFGQSPSVFADSPCHNKCNYIEPYQQANCENRFLEAVPVECNAASYLSLRHNQISRIEPGTFSVFPFLKYLILSNNGISEIEANTFMGAPQLKSIKVLYNNLRTVDPFALNGTANRLRSIYLSRNYIFNIPEGTFQSAPKLEIIDLYNNSLTNITTGVFRNLENLERLSLGMNNLVALSADTFSDLSSLIYLDLSNNSISYLAEGLFAGLFRLKTLYLSGNMLVTIGDSLHIPTLDRLDLRWNKLIKIENLTWELLDNIRVLKLEYNLWYCDCELEPLRLWYQEHSPSDRSMSVDKPNCTGPAELVNRTINSLSSPLCFENVVHEIDHDQNYTEMDLDMNRPKLMTTKPLLGSNDSIAASVPSVHKYTQNISTFPANSGLQTWLKIAIPCFAVVSVFAVMSYLVHKYNRRRKAGKQSSLNIEQKESQMGFTTPVKDKRKNEEDMSDTEQDEQERTPLITDKIPSPPHSPKKIGMNVPEDNKEKSTQARRKIDF